MQPSVMEHRRLLLKFLLGSPLLSLGCTPTEQKTTIATPSLEDLITKASDAINIFDFEKIANQKLPPAHLGYLTTGVRDNFTRDANQEAYRAIKLSLHRLIDTRKVDMTTTLFGKRWPTPLFLSPLSSQHAFHEDGELATARAAKAKNHLQILSTVTTESVEDVSKERGEPVWYQLYPLTEWEGTLKMIRRAEATGCEVLVVTVDLVGGTSNRETLDRMSRIDTRTCTNCHSGNRFERKPMLAGIKDPEMDRIVTWEMLDKIKSSTKMKVIVKGIERADDAALCVTRGMDGIVVSNHGGRAGETARGTIEALPDIAAIVKKRIPVLIDGGVRRGTDIFKALALGADAVGIGRPYIWGLTAFGQEGVETVLTLLVREFELAMQQAGTRTLQEINRNFIA